MQRAICLDVMGPRAIPLRMAKRSSLQPSLKDLKYLRQYDGAWRLIGHVEVYLSFVDEIEFLHVVIMNKRCGLFVDLQKFTQALPQR